jgi:hypothetical protein
MKEEFCWHLSLSLYSSAIAIVCKAATTSTAVLRVSFKHCMCWWIAAEEDRIIKYMYVCLSR